MGPLRKRRRTQVPPVPDFGEHHPVIVTFISAVASSQEEAVLMAVQLLWIKIVMGNSLNVKMVTQVSDDCRSVIL